MKPVLLDLFCGAGGATRGYQQAGFHVIGIDNRPQPHYCGDEFVQADAIDWLRWAALVNRFRNNPAGPWAEVDIDRLVITPFYCPSLDPDNIAAVHMSPPCQDYSQLRASAGEHGTGWILPTSIRLLKAIQPGRNWAWVVENVPGAPMPGAVTVCGAALGCYADTPTHGRVWLKRHRQFLSNVLLMVPPCACGGTTKLAPVYGHMGHAKASDGMHKRIIRGPGTRAACAAVMGIDWMTGKELVQAIPPAYTQFIGGQILDWLNHQEGAIA